MRMPVLFVGHGNPMNAIEKNAWSSAFKALAPRLPRPKAILCFSAHWYVDGTFLTAMEKPRTIHDFGGFPDELYSVQYPAPGDPALASRACGLLGLGQAGLNRKWGLDHGSWSVLKHLYPDADVPVVQLSIDENMAADRHLATGRALAPLRDEGVLLMGSGNIVHNLADAFDRMSRSDRTTPDWARNFDENVAEALEQGQESWLVTALDSPDGRMSHPTPDHWLPLLVAAGAGGPGSRVDFPVQGFDMGSLGMRAALWQ